MQDRSVAKRDHIMKTAAVLFVEHGFEHTTLAMVAKASGAAIGSITHFFGDKSELAAAVLEDVARPLIAHVDAALREHPKDVGTAIRALLASCSDWAIGHPEHPRLIAQLEAIIWKRDASSSQWGRHGLTTALEKWAAPLVAKQRIKPLSAAQLYAVIMAPILDALRSDLEEAAGASTLDWLPAFTEAAIVALTGPLRASRSDRYSKPVPKTKKAAPIFDAPILIVAPSPQGNFLPPVEEKSLGDSRSTTKSHAP